jgi:hypothetical protein
MAKTKFRKHKFTIAERYAVYGAFNKICIYCDNPVEWKDFEVDHILQESLLQEPIAIFNQMRP